MSRFKTKPTPDCVLRDSLAVKRRWTWSEELCLEAGTADGGRCGEQRVLCSAGSGVGGPGDQELSPAPQQLKRSPKLPRL